MRDITVVWVCVTVAVVAACVAAVSQQWVAQAAQTEQMAACVQAGGEWLPSGPGRFICSPGVAE